MRSTKVVSMWPVALVGALRWEGPICKNGKVIKFFTGWKPSRKFPVDMAAFAINLKLLLVERRDARIEAEVARGSIESDFLSNQLLISVGDVEAKADDCTRVSLWLAVTSLTLRHIFFISSVPNSSKKTKGLFWRDIDWPSGLLNSLSADDCEWLGDAGLGRTHSSFECNLFIVNLTNRYTIKDMKVSKE